MKSATLLRLFLVVAFLAAIVSPVSADAEFDKVAAAADAWANSGKPMVITADKLFEALNDGDKANDPVVVDVRQAKDYALGHIPGAINVPFADVFKPESMAKIPKDKPVVFTCYTGHTASMASLAYNTMGYSTQTLKWAIMGWTKDETVAPNRFGKGNDPERDYKVETTANTLAAAANPLPNLATGKTAVADILSTRAAAVIAKPVTITSDKVFEVLNDGDKANDPLVVDMRAPADYAKGHIPGAVNITLANLFKPATLASLPANKQIVLSCYTGHTSSMASVTLASLGYNAISLKWGIMGWTKDTNVAPMRFGVGADAEKDFKLEKPAAAATTTAPAAATTAAPAALPKTGGAPFLPAGIASLAGLAALAAGVALRRNSR